MAFTRFTTTITLGLLLCLNPSAHGQFIRRTEVITVGQTSTVPAAASTATATILSGGSGNPPEPYLGPFPDTMLDDMNPAFQYSPANAWAAAHVGPACDVFSCTGDPSTTLTYNKTWHEVADTGIHGDPPPKITLTFQGQNYGTVSFLTPINQPFPQDITFLYTFTLDGTLVSTYNSTLPRLGDAGSQPPNYIWNPTVIFISFPEPGLHTLEIDVLQGPMLFDHFQFFKTKPTGGGAGDDGGDGVAGGKAKSKSGEQVTTMHSSMSTSAHHTSTNTTSFTSSTNTVSQHNGSIMLNVSPYIYSAMAIFLDILFDWDLV